MMIDLLTAAPGPEFHIPGSTLPVRLARLHGATSVVRFPAGWERRPRGHYLAGEEFVILAGALHVSGVTYAPGHHAWLPAGTLRHDSAAPEGAVALARFAGPPTWVPSLLDEADGPTVRTPLESVVIPPGGLALSPLSWLRDSPVPLQGSAEIVTVGTWTWQLSAFMPEGRVLVRA
ncbi:hypothetical protein ACIBHY_07130 [Nonomuraea sp. NPDC050547]|uniref:hypothetical protein n=1 Tax=unclassified Nonomuraea TaxID=2593643 RepID=UPI003792CB93